MILVTDIGHDPKAMHDVLAAKCFLDDSIGIWEQAKPTWNGNKLFTTQTNENIFTLIGLHKE